MTPRERAAATARIAALIDAIPCPWWVADAIEAHHRREVLVLQIWMLSDRTTAIAALWLARASWALGGSVEGTLRVIRDALLCGSPAKEARR